MKTLDILAGVLLIVGGLNWGLWAAFEFDLVAALFGGSTELLAKVVYGLVGLAAIYGAISGIRSLSRSTGGAPALA